MSDKLQDHRLSLLKDSTQSIYKIVTQNDVDLCIGVNTSTLGVQIQRYDGYLFQRWKLVGNENSNSFRIENINTGFVIQYLTLNQPLMVSPSTSGQNIQQDWLINQNHQVQLQNKPNYFWFYDPKIGSALKIQPGQVGKTPGTFWRFVKVN